LTVVVFDNRFDQFSGESSQCKRECCQRLVEQSTPYQSCGKSILSATIQRRVRQIFESQMVQRF